MRGLGRRPGPEPPAVAPEQAVTTDVAMPFMPGVPKDVRGEGEDHMALAEARQESRTSEARTSAPSELNALLGRGSEFDGKLTFEGTVRIDGTFSGEISTTDTLIIGEGAKVQAEISCGTLLVHGEITGNVTASVAVELHQPARVKGDVMTPSLMVEKGVLFQGTSKMTEQTASNVVRFASTADGTSD